MLIRPDGSPLRDNNAVVIPPAVRPFDRHRGEMIGNLGQAFVVVPMSKWSDTVLPGMAVNAAKKVFTRKTTNTTIPNLRFDDETILVQEYHSQDRIAVIVAAWGRQMGMKRWAWIYHVTVFKIEGTLKQQLEMSGRWKSTVVH